jgi:hypothetical protein
MIQKHHTVRMTQKHHTVRMRQKHHTVRMIQKSNTKIIDRGKINTSNTQIHDL